MEEKSEITVQDDLQKSLIPTIRAEETRLQEMLTEAEAQTAAAVDKAQRQAAELVRETRRMLPEWIETQRDSQLEQIQIEADQRRDSRPERIEALQETAVRNTAAAVDCILAGVWGKPE
jgi:vacuolar-type H+-ATPase subunit H